MAKLSVAYPLCPLIDQKSLLGVTEDSSSDCVIVTLGKNIVIRYRLLDQKQVRSWSSKDKLSSPVIYDKHANQYVAVFNRNQLRMWDDSTQQLDKVKKLKFERHIHCVLPQQDDIPLIVFHDGDVEPLDVAVENRKNSSVVTGDVDNQVIENCQLVACGGQKYVTFLTITSTKTYFNVVSVSKREHKVRIPLDRPNTKLVGHIVLHNDTKCYLHTLWSDGKFFCANFTSDQQIQVPGILAQTICEISTDHTVAMVPVSNHHIAMYGAHISKEGAILIIFNTQYQLTQAKQTSKLFGIFPRLWCIGANLFFANGNFLAVVPYRLDVARLAALVGAHGSKEQQVQKADWGNKKEIVLFKDAPDSIRNELIELAERGWPQFSIFQEIFPSLMDKKDLSTIVWCLRNFDDIPEISIVVLLKFSLSETSSTFDNIDVLEDDGEDVITQLEDLSPKKQKFLDYVMSVPFGDVYLLPHLRSLSFSDTLLLLRHLSLKLAESSDVKLLEWLGLLLDSHYQQYILSKDPLVLEVLNSLRSIVDSHLTDIEGLRSLAPLVQRLSLGKPVVRPSQTGSNNNYSIEALRLY